jgi:diguanylate cyclase (GGDEF)-like protein/PAS domain S-box-containing protein
MMTERNAVRRLRMLSAVGAAAIVGVLIIQVVILITLSLTTLPASRSINASGLRRGLTLRILYDSTIHDDGDLHRAIVALSENQENFGDLSPSEETVFDRFVTHPTRADGFALFELFNAKTNAYEVAARVSRARFRIGAIVTGLVAIAIALLVYFRLARPSETAWAAMVERLDESRERFRSMFEFHPDAIALIDEDGRIVQANPALERLSLYRADDLVGVPLDTLAPAPDAIEHAGLAQQLFSNASRGFEAAMRTRTGSALMVHVDTVPMRVSGTLEGVYVIARDVTQQRELEFRERSQRERLRALARISSVHAGSVERQIAETLQFAMLALELKGAVVTRVYDDEVRVVHSVGETLPVGATYPFAESYTRHIFGANKMIVFWDQESNEWLNDPAQARFGWGALITTTAFADGVPVGAVSFMARPVRRHPFEEADLDFARVVAAMIGASLARERREDELEAIAYVDAVTRLPNRRYAMEQLRLAIARAERSGETVVAYFIDLDGFKGVNDAFGHAVGDEFLAITAARLRAVLREGDVLARVGGDEFLAIQSGPPDDAGALRLGERLIEAASDRAIFDGRSVRVGASVGIAVSPRDATTAEELLERADQAMYASKRAGKGVATLSS